MSPTEQRLEIHPDQQIQFSGDSGVRVTNRKAEGSRNGRPRGDTGLTLLASALAKQRACLQLLRRLSEVVSSEPDFCYLTELSIPKMSLLDSKTWELSEVSVQVTDGSGGQAGRSSVLCTGF